MPEARLTDRAYFRLKNCRAHVSIPNRTIRVIRPDFTQVLYRFGADWSFRRLTFRNMTPGYKCSFDHITGTDKRGHTISASGAIEQAHQEDLAVLARDVRWPQCADGRIVALYEDGQQSEGTELWVPFESGHVDGDAAANVRARESPANIAIGRFENRKMRFAGIVLLATDWASVGTIFFQVRSPFDRMPYSDVGPAVIQPEGELHWTYFDAARSEYVKCKSGHEWRKLTGVGVG